MRLTKIYTKVGDKGTTMLAGGTRVPKDDVRIEAYGTIDELNAQLGMMRDALLVYDTKLFADLTASLARIQNEMHDLGGELATPTESLDVAKQQTVTKQSISDLENEIDQQNSKLEPLTNFVLPGGHVLNSHAQICRTICRRTERRLWSLSNQQTVREEPLVYTNRLSDWLFVVGRTISSRLNAPEVLWQQAEKS